MSSILEKEITEIEDEISILDKRLDDIEKKADKISDKLDNLLANTKRQWDKYQEIEQTIITLNQRISNIEIFIESEKEEKPKKTEKIDKIIRDFDLLKQSHDICREERKQEKDWKSQRKGSLMDQIVIAIIGAIGAIIAFIAGKGGLK